MKSIFDFDLIKKFIKTQKETVGFKLLFDSLNGVTGPYGKALFVDELGLSAEESLQNYVPKPDFGGLHPDPNLTYAHTLVERVDKDKIAFGAASDGDGDRNMIYGYGPAFVSPGDSVAIIAEYASEIPYFAKQGIYGLARSFPTSAAIDRVATVSYTHLDVYKRQLRGSWVMARVRRVKCADIWVRYWMVMENKKVMQNYLFSILFFNVLHV